MEVSVISPGGLERRMKVQLPAEQVEQAVSERIRRIGNRARIPGFRPGKAPLPVLQQRFGAQAREEAVGELIQNSYVDALQKSELRPAGQPSIELPQAPLSGQALEYTAVFDVYPQIELKALDQIEVQKPQVEITDADVERVITSLRQQHKTYCVVERASVADDQLKIDFAGLLDGQPFNGNSAQDFELVLGAGRLLKSMENSLVGRKAGESYSVDVDFPADYPAEHLKGKRAVFAITVKQVTEPVLPALSDEFLKTVGVIEGGATALQAKIHTSLTRQAEKTVQGRLKEQVLEQLLKRNPLDLPRGLVAQELARMRQEALGRLPPRMQRELGKDGSRLAELLPEDSFREGARRRVALGLLVGEVIKSRKLELDRSRLEQSLAGLAADYDKPDDVIRYYRANPQLMQGVEAMVMEEQVVESLLAGAQIKHQASSFEELMRPPHGAPGHQHGPDCDH
ncbi:MAG: trigger factor [Nevskiales bacterium]